ncbi:MAG: flavodoxin-dependent (E)-4-hydroxy-3-methylbut-2-enyl-diphosphate synthase, partial [Mailhella sp.]|nr:flavodoxin-dependent (E)-4-hydroxy-3-methylbut-2-enyl-diphosphate synthase [Mailhella sp.]
MNTPHRNRTRQLKLGSVLIGGGAPVVVQSMTNTDTRDAEATLEQIRRLHAAGCEVVRLAVPDEAAADALKTIAAASPVPLIADIHFDWRLAVAALDAGLKGLRINPGNIGGSAPVDNVAAAAKANGAVIRVGVNSGSVEKELLERFGGPTPEALVESALRHVRMLEERGFYDTKISLKSSSVAHTIASYRLMAERADYPLHLGVTEAGTPMRGAIKSSVGLGLLLFEGIGD